MKTYQITPRTKICPSLLEIDIDDDGRVAELYFYGGCQTLHETISRLCTGLTPQDIILKLGGDMTCGSKSYSCQMFIRDALAGIVKGDVQCVA